MKNLRRFLPLGLVVLMVSLLAVLGMFLAATDALGGQGPNGSVNPSVLGQGPGGPVGTPVPGQGPIGPVNPPVPGQGGTCIEGTIIDSYEQPAGAGWKVTATSPTGTTRTVTADANGHFKFVNLTAGTWKVKIQVPDGWQPLTPATFAVTLTGDPKGPCAHVGIKVVQNGTIIVVKLDKNGPVTVPPIGLPDWQFEVQNPATGEVVQTCVTDWSGRCTFSLPPGTWEIWELIKVGWQLVSPATNGILVHLLPAETVTVKFINEQVYTAEIIVEKKDNAGNPLPNWPMTLTRNDGTRPPQDARTDLAGIATFTNLPLGDWTVEEATSPFWIPVTPISQSVRLTVPGERQAVTFINEPALIIDGFKINNLNEGLAAWTIVATNVETGVKFTTQTDPTGFFSFDRLTAGVWQVSEILQPGWEPVTPDVITVTLTSKSSPAHIRFKNKTDFACLDVFKIEEFRGIGLPGWQITVQPAFDGSPLVGITDGTGHVRFNALTPGIYDVTESVEPGWTPVTPVTLRVNLQATGSCQVVKFINRQETQEEPAPQPHPCEIIVDDMDPGFAKYGPASGWHNDAVGYKNHTLWTRNNANHSDNSAKWTPVLPTAGKYEVFVFIPRRHANTRNARYVIVHNDARQDLHTVNQSLYYDKWVSLGTYYFKADGKEYVYLDDKTGEPYLSRYIGFDAVKFVRR